jgi:hypothetical protein
MPKHDPARAVMARLPVRSQECCQASHLADSGKQPVWSNATIRFIHHAFL